MLITLLIRSILLAGLYLLVIGLLVLLKVNIGWLDGSPLQLAWYLLCFLARYFSCLPLPPASRVGVVSERT